MKEVFKGGKKYMNLDWVPYSILQNYLPNIEKGYAKDTSTNC